MTFYKQMGPALSVLLKSGETLTAPIYGTLIQKRKRAFGYFGLTDTALLVALLQGSSKKLGAGGRFELSSIQNVVVKRSLFPLFYILHLELSEGISLKILFSKRVFGFDTQEKNLRQYRTEK